MTVMILIKKRRTEGKAKEKRQEPEKPRTTTE
jgi:hypothetical protein